MGTTTTTAVTKAVIKPASVAIATAKTTLTTVKVRTITTTTAKKRH